VPPGSVPAEFQVGSNSTVPATLPIPDGYIAPDTRTVVLQPIIAKPKAKIDHTKPLLPVDGGTTKLHGTVFAPDGSPVEGATVRLERFSGLDFGILDVTTAKDGTWHFDTALGGRYRIRAWLKPSLTTVQPQAIFITADHGDGVVDLTMERHDGLTVQGALNEAQPHVGQQVPFRALVTQETVDDNGVVQGVGAPGITVQLAANDGVKVIGSGTATTGPDGFAPFTVACLTTGDHSVVVVSLSQSPTVALPTCLDGSIANLPPDTPDFAVGTSFTVPFAGPVPAGTYTSTDPGNCTTSYETYDGTNWTAGVSLEHVITTTAPTRSFAALGGSTPCTFTRTA
jgi:hypothetical protein